MTARYIMRLDDACPTMNRKYWDKLEQLFLDYDIKPIVAVIPDNQDQSMRCSVEDTAFWDKVRSWQDKGWEIALHGHTHEYTTQDSGIFNYNQQSEFVGLSLSEQRVKLQKAWAIFQEQSLKSRLFVAPSHSLDLNTLEALRLETSISVISDGIALSSYHEYGFDWIPCQLWRFRYFPFGLFTICLHPNTMTEKEFNVLESAIKSARYSIVSVEDSLVRNSPKSLLSQFVAFLYWRCFSLKKFVSLLKKSVMS